MTGELVQTGTGPRVISSGIGPVVPVIDLAENIGYSRSSITNTITKNEDLFQGFTTYEILPTQGGDQRFLCMNSTGIDRLLFLIKPAKNRKELCERVETFRAKTFGRLAEQKEVVQQPATTPSIDEELVRARYLAEQTGGDLASFQAIAFRKCGLGEWVPALNIPPVIHGEAGWYNPTQLGDRCGLTAQEVNSFLYNRGYQYPQGSIWRLQPKGEAHAEEYWYTTTSKHSEIRIRWRESILVASGLVREQPAPAQALPARA